ncbi:hypothetical protein JIN85_07220 [Luteolibacter pohnpeiensis]|uniref:GP-PDE domain-containing protein n=1 Tax=Luteolibacter pohnpeiensis TaxID=454153 RepID=A0A934SBE1_9BACT|nr:glycerophosphodiester phosphodiesterase family protein [Luteolibacter pohnpeiensis]MBK1882198.1 hypothetical protein [Luteolibacter pohnpeiensis]
MKTLLPIGMSCVMIAFANAGPVKLIAHRGASHAAPENTLSSFRLAWEEGADGIEGDFYLTPDGEVVCIHDADTKRVANKNLVVQNTPWPELAKLDVGSWKSEKYHHEHIPRLGDVLDILPEGKMFFLEIKDGIEIVAPIRKILETKKANPKQVVLISFDQEVIKECRRQLPQFEAHWLSSLKNFKQPGMADGYFEELKSLGAQGFQFNSEAPVTSSWINQLKQSGYKIDAWTVDNPIIAKQMIDLGVDFITTNQPKDLRTQLFQNESSWNVRQHIPRQNFIIQSHRGAGELMPENSAESFRLAWKLGTIPEADLRTTKDGVIVAFHDNDFTRILPNESDEIRKRSVEDFTWEELSKLDIGAWKGDHFRGQRIPSLEDIFQELKEDDTRRVYVDIKNIDLKQLAKEAHLQGLANRLILASTHIEVIREWKELAPESSTLHWMGGSEQDLEKRIHSLEKENFAGIDQLQIHVKPSQSAPDGFTPSADFLRNVGSRLRKHDVLFQTLPWGSRDPELFTRLLDLGVASFATDFPDVAAETVTSYYQKAE